MLDFHTPKPEEREQAIAAIAAHRSSIDPGASHAAFGTTYLWSEAYGAKIAFYKDFYLIRYGTLHVFAYTFPIERDSFYELWALVREDAAANGKQCRLWGFSEGEKQLLLELEPHAFEIVEDRDNADYLYLSEDLRLLSGRKYHGKRNHISKFRSMYSYTFELLTPENLFECLTVAKKWANENEDFDDFIEEYHAILKAIEQFKALSLSGGLIRIDGMGVAFTIGEAVNEEVFDLHFEKALTEYEGLYAVINQEFAAAALSGYRLINREEDMGLEGLKRSKESYYPVRLSEKYAAIQIGELEHERG